MRNLSLIKDLDIKAILQMSCKFNDYEVLYDDEATMKYWQRRAKLCSVKTTQTKPHQTDYETCEGTVENCIRYLNDYISGDYGYMAGQCLNIVGVKPTVVFKTAFTKFIDWLSSSKRYQDFKTGVADGDMAEFLIN